MLFYFMAAVWLVLPCVGAETRQNFGQPFFLVGQYCGDDVVVQVAAGTVAQPVSTVITNPNLVEISVNDINWGSSPTANDRLQIPTDGSIPLTLRWKNGKWGQTVVDPAQRKSVWKTEFKIKPGTGFWYVRRGGQFEVTVPVQHKNIGD